MLNADPLDHLLQTLPVQPTTATDAVAPQPAGPAPDATAASGVGAIGLVEPTPGSGAEPLPAALSAESGDVATEGDYASEDEWVWEYEWEYVWVPVWAAADGSWGVWIDDEVTTELPTESTDEQVRLDGPPATDPDEGETFPIAAAAPADGPAVPPTPAPVGPPAPSPASNREAYDWFRRRMAEGGPTQQPVPSIHPALLAALEDAERNSGRRPTPVPARPGDLSDLLGITWLDDAPNQNGSAPRPNRLDPFRDFDLFLRRPAPRTFVLPAEPAAPAVAAAPGEPGSFLSDLTDVVSWVGIVDPTGVVSLGEAGLHFIQGNNGEGIFALAGAVPLFGKVAKVVRKADKVADAAKAADKVGDAAKTADNAAPATIRNQALLDPHNSKPSLQAELYERERNAVQFGQKRIGENFRQYSEAPDFIRGRPVADVAADLRAGNISPDSLPVSYFVYNGQLVAINNRGLAALAEAGMRPTVLRRVPLDQVPASVLERLTEAPIVRNQTIPGPMIPVTKDAAGTDIVRVIELPK